MTAAFSKCIELSRYADAPVKKAPPSGDRGGSRAKLVEASLTKPAVTAPTPAPNATVTHGWTYAENVPEKPEFNAIRAGVTTTAMPLRATDFGVESTAPFVKPEVAGRRDGRQREASAAGDGRDDARAPRYRKCCAARSIASRVPTASPNTTT